MRVVTRPLRLLYVVDSLGLGGANQTTVTLAAAMRARGHDVSLASADGPLRETLERAGVAWVPVSTAVRHPDLPTVRRLVETLRGCSPDLVCPNGFDCTVETLPAAMRCGTPVFPTYGGLFTPAFPHPWLPRVNVFSWELAEDLVRRFGWERATFRNLIARIDGSRFHPGIDGAAMRRTLGVAPEAPLLVMVCRHDLTKLQGVLTLIDAAPGLREALPGLRIALFGDGDGHALVLERSAALGELVTAPGSTRQTAEAFAAADLVVANGARSALEAMACARPVLSVGPNGFCGLIAASNVEGFRRFNFDKGRLAGNPIGEASQLVRVARRLLLDRELYRGACEFSATYSREHLVIQTRAEDYEAAYREVIADPWPRSGDRRRVWLRWGSALWRSHAHRLGRRLGRERRGPAAYDRLQPPPPGLDPQWNTGVPDAAPS